MFYIYKVFATAVEIIFTLFCWYGSRIYVLLGMLFGVIVCIHLTHLLF